MKAGRIIASTRPGEKVYIRCLYCTHPVKQGSAKCPHCNSTHYDK